MKLYAWQSKDNDTVLVCAECGGKSEIKHQPCGEGDYLNYCEDCQTLEGKTEEITEDEYERRNS